jgi:hypothetical protein
LVDGIEFGPILGSSFKIISLFDENRRPSFWPLLEVRSIWKKNEM